MRGFGARGGVGLLAAALVALAGCATDNRIRPPKQPEQYNSPPANEERYAGPPPYPKGSLNKGLPRKDDDIAPVGAGPGVSGTRTKAPGPSNGYGGSL